MRCNRWLCGAAATDREHLTEPTGIAAACRDLAIPFTEIDARLQAVATFPVFRWSEYRPDGKKR